MLSRLCRAFRSADDASEIDADRDVTARQFGKGSFSPPSRPRFQAN
jgi:hypothetical protein